MPVIHTIPVLQPDRNTITADSNVNIHTRIIDTCFTVLPPVISIKASPIEGGREEGLLVPIIATSTHVCKANPVGLSNTPLMRGLPIMMMSATKA